MKKTTNKLLAFCCWLLALLKIKAKGESLMANCLIFITWIEKIKREFHTKKAKSLVVRI
jgi:hypothetical protein